MNRLLQRPVAQKHKLEVLLYGDCADLEVFGGASHQLEEVLIFVVYLDPLDSFIFHSLLIGLDGIHFGNGVVACVNLIAHVCLGRLLVHSEVRKTDAPPPEHVLVVAV